MARSKVAPWAARRGRQKADSMVDTRADKMAALTVVDLVVGMVVLLAVRWAALWACQSADVSDFRRADKLVGWLENQMAVQTACSACCWAEHLVLLKADPRAAAMVEPWAAVTAVLRAIHSVDLWAVPRAEQWVVSTAA